MYCKMISIEDAVLESGMQNKNLWNKRDTLNQAQDDFIKAAKAMGEYSKGAIKIHGYEKKEPLKYRIPDRILNNLREVALIELVAAGKGIPQLMHSVLNYVPRGFDIYWISAEEMDKIITDVIRGTDG
jgi:hypothetical protein